MGDLAADTAVEALGDGRYRASVSRDWEIWGPMGGYVASIALRAAGAESPQPRPAAFSCQFLGVADFAPVEVHVEARREARTAAAHRVSLTQEGRPILDAMVWSIGDVEGLEHDETVGPDVPGPDGLPTMRELLEAEDVPMFRFWDNIEQKPLHYERVWPPDGPRDPRWQEWMRFQPAATFDDPWVDAARSVILVDLPSWPAAHRPHAWQEPPFTAPTLDLNVAFHQPAHDEPWLLCDGAAPLATGGLFGWQAKVWSPSGRLHASGGGQCLFRKTRPPT